MRSASGTTGAAPARDSQWARKARKERLPVELDEYLRGWEDFFDDYAGSVELF